MITLETIYAAVDDGLAQIDARIKAETPLLRDTTEWEVEYNRHFVNGGDDVMKQRAVRYADGIAGVPRPLNEQRANYERRLLVALLGRYAQTADLALYDTTAERHLLTRLNAEMVELPRIDADKIDLI